MASKKQNYDASQSLLAPREGQSDNYGSQPSPYSQGPQGPQAYQNQGYPSPQGQGYPSPHGTAPSPIPSQKGAEAPPPSYQTYVQVVYRSSDHSLPDGWEVYRDQASGNAYYCNMVTMQTTWAHPATGVQADASLPSYAVPDYYAHVEVQQTAQMAVEFNPGLPSGHFDPEASAAPYAANSQYSPLYYDNLIKSTLNPNLLNQQQLDSIAPRYLDSAKYSQNLTFRQRCCGTCSNNITLTVVSVLLWIAIAVTLGIVFIGQADVQPEMFAGIYIMYGLYTILFTIPAGLCPLSWFCCGWSPLLSDKMVETLRHSANPNTDTLLNHIDSLARASPVLTLHVHCWHNETTHYTEQVRQQNGSYKTVHKTRTTAVTTFRGNRAVPIIRWKDLSPPSAVVADVINQCPSNIVSVGYKHVYELHPLQVNVLNDLKKQYYYLHCYRDDHCSVTSDYAITTEKKSVDVVVKERNCGYWSSHIFFFNPLSFFLWMYATLLLPIACLFRTFVRPIPHTNVKYLHIDNPNPHHDVVTFNSPRWRLRWSWY